MAAAKLYNNDTKTWDMVPDHMVTDNVAKGNYSFESGIKVPAVDRQGNLVDVPSEHVQEAFQNGYRWSTDQDVKANIAAQNEAIMEKNYGDGHGIQALGLGAVEGAIPGADYYMQGLASTMGGRPQDVTQGAQQLAARNPGAHLAGELAGAVSSPITEVLGGGASALGEEAATRALGSAANTLGGKVATKAIGSSLEGAYFGLHDGLNESALGEPGEVAETLMSSAGQGLLFGGVTGAAFPLMGGAAKPIKNFIGDKVDVLSDAAKKTAQLVTKGTTLATLPQDVRKAASAFIGNEDLRNIVYSKGGLDTVRSLTDDIASSTKELQGESSGLLGELKDYVKGAPRQTQEKIDNALNDAGGDFYGATQSAFNTWSGQRESLMSNMLSDTSPGTMFQDIDKKTGKLMKELAAYGDRNASAKVGELSNFIEAQKTAAGLDETVPRLVDDTGPRGRTIYSPDDYASKLTAGKEMKIAQELRERAVSGISSLPDELQVKVQRYHDDLTSMMHDHPIFGEGVADMDRQYDAMDALRSFVNDKTGNVTNDVMAKLKTDPEYAHELDAVMSQFPDSAPIIQNFKNAVEDPLAQQVHLNQLKQAIRDAGANTYGRIKDEDIQQLASLFGNGDIAQKSDRLREIQEAMSQQNVGPITKLAANLRALGRPVPKIFEQLEPHQAGLAGLMDALGKSGDQSVVEKVLRKAAFGGIKGRLMDFAAGAVGGSIGHGFLHGPVGVIAGSLTSSIMRRLFNPISGFESLTKLESRINKNSARLKAATDFAIDALTSDTARKVTIRGAAFTPSTTEERRANWKNRADFLTQLKDPEALSQVAEERLGSAQAAPNITAAMHAQFAKTVDFLSDKVPQDPLAHQSLSAANTGWKPSDMELAKFERFHQAAINPEQALNNIAHGKATSEEFQTLETLYPTYFKRLQEGLVNAIMDPKSNLTFSQKQKIGAMFGIAASPSAQPTFIAAMQGNFDNTAAKGFSPGGMKSNPKVQFDPQRQSTDVERLTYS